MSDTKFDWFPTQAGRYTAYLPQFKEKDEWRDVPMVRGQSGFGSPFPLACGGINETIWLCGYAQAQALAWQHAANYAAAGKDIEVRVVPYEVMYDIKARRLEPESGSTPPNTKGEQIEKQ